MRNNAPFQLNDINILQSMAQNLYDSTLKQVVFCLKIQMFIKDNLGHNL